MCAGGGGATCARRIGPWDGGGEWRVLANSLQPGNANLTFGCQNIPKVTFAFSRVAGRVLKLPIERSHRTRTGALQPVTSSRLGQIPNLACKTTRIRAHITPTGAALLVGVHSDTCVWKLRWNPTLHNGLDDEALQHVKHVSNTMIESLITGGNVAQIDFKPPRHVFFWQVMKHEFITHILAMRSEFVCACVQSDV